MIEHAAGWRVGDGLSSLLRARVAAEMGGLWVPCGPHPRRLPQRLVSAQETSLR
jgi:hypothetical protein